MIVKVELLHINVMKLVFVQSDGQTILEVTLLEINLRALPKIMLPHLIREALNRLHLQDN